MNTVDELMDFYDFRNKIETRGKGYQNRVPLDVDMYSAALYIDPPFHLQRDTLWEDACIESCLLEESGITERLRGFMSIIHIRLLNLVNKQSLAEYGIYHVDKTILDKIVYDILNSHFIPDNNVKYVLRILNIYNNYKSSFCNKSEVLKYYGGDELSLDTTVDSMYKLCFRRDICRESMVECDRMMEQSTNYDEYYEFWRE